VKVFTGHSTLSTNPFHPLLLFAPSPPLSASHITPLLWKLLTPLFVSLTLLSSSYSPASRDAFIAVVLMYTNQKGIQFSKQSDADNIYRRLEEEVFELRSENTVLRDKVKILQELLNSKDKTIPKGNPMEIAKLQQEENQQLQNIQHKQVPVEVEEEEEEGISAQPINYIPTTSTPNYTTNTPTTNKNDTYSQNQHQNYVDPAQQYNRNPMYYLLVLCMMLIFIYKTKLVRAENENRRMQEEFTRLRAELVNNMESFMDVFRNWSLEWRGSNMLVKQRVEEFRRLLKDPERWTKEKEEERHREEYELTSSTGSTEIDKQFSIE
jgi:hypothetical protein